jgi:hypothetical protein
MTICTVASDRNPYFGVEQLTQAFRVSLPGAADPE